MIPGLPTYSAASGTQHFIDGLDRGCSLPSPKALETTQRQGPIFHQLNQDLRGWGPGICVS